MASAPAARSAMFAETALQIIRSQRRFRKELEEIFCVIRQTIGCMGQTN
jgi:hypothetical protein